MKNWDYKKKTKGRKRKRKVRTRKYIPSPQRKTNMFENENIIYSRIRRFNKIKGKHNHQGKN